MSYWDEVFLEKLINFYSEVPIIFICLVLSLIIISMMLFIPEWAINLFYIFCVTAGVMIPGQILWESYEEYKQKKGEKP